MAHTVTIAGRKVEIAWSNEISRRFRFRLGLIGGHPSKREITTPATAEAAYVKILWALLPVAEHARFATPEDLFVALGDNADAAREIFDAVTGVYAEMEPDAEKKTNGRKQPSPA